MIVEFNRQDSLAFDEVLEVLERYPDFEYVQINDDSILSVPGLEIYPSRRKIYRGRKEISLMVKEYDLFYLLVVNRGQVLTYGQIYQNVWGAEAIGRENNARNAISGICVKNCSGRCRMPLLQSGVSGKLGTEKRLPILSGTGNGICLPPVPVGIFLTQARFACLMIPMESILTWAIRLSGTRAILLSAARLRV